VNDKIRYVLSSKELETELQDWKELLIRDLKKQVDDDVADPGEVVLTVGSALATLKGREGVPLILHVVDPGEVLNRFAGSMGHAVFGSVVPQRPARTLRLATKGSAWDSNPALGGTGLESQQEDQKGRPHQCIPGIIQLIGIAGIGESLPRRRRGRKCRMVLTNTGPNCGIVFFSRGGPACRHVATDDRQRVVRYLADQSFDSLVLLHPPSHLLHHVLGHVDGPGLSLDLVGQHVRRVKLPPRTLAAGVAPPSAGLTRQSEAATSGLHWASCFSFACLSFSNRDIQNPLL